jgi:hypothetical protein
MYPIMIFIANKTQKNTMIIQAIKLINKPAEAPEATIRGEEYYTWKFTNHETHKDKYGFGTREEANRYKNTVLLSANLYTWTYSPIKPTNDHNGITFNILTALMD